MMWGSHMYPMGTSLLRNKTPGRSELRVLLLVLLAINVAVAFHIIHLTTQQAQIKRDYAHVNSLRHGFFSMDTWKLHFERIVSKSILNLKLSPQDAVSLKAEIEKVVRVMITQADTILTKNQKTLGSRVRKAAYKALVDVPRLAKKSPEFAEAVMQEITKPESLEQIRILALNQLNKYAGETRNNDMEGPPLAPVLAHYNVPSISEFNRVVTPRIQSLHNKIRISILFMIGSVMVVGLLWVLLRDQTALHKLLYRMSAGLAAIVLFTSLAVPMLDIDARIKTIDLLLLGEPIQFANQVLFYRSKSILEVVRILMVSGKADTFIVGFLLLLFSVIFPLVKLTSTVLCLSRDAYYRKNKWIQFFAYDSGKWSMADVMVVAIFMAYIGFNSLLNDQLKGMNVTSESWQMITTHETSLQPGFILFVTFVIFGLVLSEILKRIVARDRTHAEIVPPARYNPPRMTVVS